MNVSTICWWQLSARSWGKTRPMLCWTTVASSDSLDNFYCSETSIFTFFFFGEIRNLTTFCLLPLVNNGFSLSSFFLSLLSYLWIGAQFPQEKFLSYGRILTLHYYFLLMCILFSYSFLFHSRTSNFQTFIISYHFLSHFLSISLLHWKGFGKMSTAFLSGYSLYHVISQRIVLFL